MKRKRKIQPKTTQAKRPAHAKATPELSDTQKQIIAGWFPLWMMAAAFDMPRQSFHEAVRQLIAAADIRGAGERGTLIRCAGAIEAWAKSKLERANLRNSTALFFDGRDCEWLEIYREFTAKLKKLEFEDKQRKLINRAEIIAGLGILAARLRTAVDRIRERFGDDAASILAESVNEAEGAWMKMVAGWSQNEGQE
jgi:hypothetical protein